MTTKVFNKIVDDYSQRLYVFLYNTLRDSDECKNLVQDTFETLWINRETVDIENIKSYLFTLAYRKMIDLTRRNKTINQYLSNIQIGFQSSTIKSLETKDILTKAFNELNKKYKHVILLRDQEGYSYEEIANITGLTAPTVRTNIFRGRQALREIIEQIENYREL